MCDDVQGYITDARRFQKYGEHALALSSLQLAQQADWHKEYEVEIQKLISFNYRKMGNFDMALLHINNAINQNEKKTHSEEVQNEYAVCLMNKGIIFEESKQYDDALKCYLRAIELFTLLHRNNVDKHGLIINALFTLGLFYYKQKDYVKTKDTLERALLYFGDKKETDQRYIAICNTLLDLQNKNIKVNIHYESL